MVFLGGSMEPPLCTNGSTGYLMQLSFKEMILHMAVFLHGQTSSIQVFQFRSSTVNSMPLYARGCLRGLCPFRSLKILFS